MVGRRREPADPQWPFLTVEAAAHLRTMVHVAHRERNSLATADGPYMMLERDTYADITPLAHSVADLPRSDWAAAVLRRGDDRREVIATTRRPEPPSTCHPVVGDAT